MNHDIVVVGASAHGLQPVMDLARGLSPDFPGSVFVAMHAPPSSPQMLEQLLGASAKVPVGFAVHNESIAKGRVYVAPPDRHLLVRNDRVEVVRGPRENGHRPSIDALFRSASQAYGPRVVGVVLSGYLDCGTAGLFSIKARGGVAVVQDPEEAGAPEMPTSAIHHTQVDHITRAADLPTLLSQLVRSPAPGDGSASSSSIEQLEGDPNAKGPFVEVVCPACGGTLTETNIQGFDSFRCHEGHTFSLPALAEAQSEEVERALWTASRILDENAAVLRRTAARAEGDLRQRFLDRAALNEHSAKVLRDLIARGLA